MNKNSVKATKIEKEYRILLRNLRLKKEENSGEKTNNKKTDCHQPK